MKRYLTGALCIWLSACATTAVEKTITFNPSKNALLIFKISTPSNLDIPHRSVTGKLLGSKQKKYAYISKVDVAMGIIQEKYFKNNFKTTSISDYFVIELPTSKQKQRYIIRGFSSEATAYNTLNIICKDTKINAIELNAGEIVYGGDFEIQSFSQSDYGKFSWDVINKSDFEAAKTFLQLREPKLAQQLALAKHEKVRTFFNNKCMDRF